MKNIVQLMPGYYLNEYMVILNPHEELATRIAKVKKEFADEYKTKMALGMKPHIALIRFEQIEMLEERIVQGLKKVAMGYHPFKIELRNFGSFPSHTIYINVVTKLPVQNLVKQIRPIQKLMKPDNDHKPHFIDEPYITVARKLLPWQYEKGWLEYSQKHFSGRFIADGMLLLKRRQGSKSFQIVQRFEFMNLPVSTIQGELFG